MVIGDEVQIEAHPEAIYACQYFREVCAPTLINYGSASFWNQLVLQACHTDESLKHLMIAASQLDMQIRQSTLFNNVAFHSHYGKGLRLITQAQNPDMDSILIACLLLMLCDELQQKYFSALQHLIAGRRILTTCHPHSSGPVGKNIIEQVGPIFSKLESSTSEFQKQLVPSISRQAIDVPYTDDIHHLSCMSQLCPFISIDQSAFALQAIALDCTRSRVHGIAPRTRFHMVTSLTANLNTWHARFIAFERNLTAAPESKMFLDVNLLRTYHLCLHIISRCAPFNQEVTFDGYCESIELVMVSCDILMTRTLTTRFIPPLFFVATRYRSLSFRRRAIKSLRRCGPDGQLLADIASRIARVEESGIPGPVLCSDIPEGKRVRIQNVELDPSAQSYVLYFKRHPFTENVISEYSIFPSQSWVWGESSLISCHAVSFSYSLCC